MAAQTSGRGTKAIARQLDQGATLRMIQAGKKRMLGCPPALPRSIAVTSGKGGVGKTSLVTNLAFVLSEMGLRVLVLDADMGLANIDVMLGLSPRYTLKDFLEGSKEMREILIVGPNGMRILPAGSGVIELTALDRDQRLSLIAEINALKEEHDVLLIDTAAGVSPNVLHFNAMAEELIVAVTPEPTSITDAYAIIKLMSQRYRRRRFLVLLNAVRSEEEARQVFHGLNCAVERFLKFSLTELGFIPYDSAVMQSIKSQRAFVECFPDARASQSMREVGQRLAQMSSRWEASGEATLFGPYA